MHHTVGMSWLLLLCGSRFGLILCLRKVTITLPPCLPLQACPLPWRPLVRWWLATRASSAWPPPLPPSSASTLRAARQTRRWGRDVGQLCISALWCASRHLAFVGCLLAPWRRCPTLHLQPCCPPTVLSPARSPASPPPPSLPDAGHPGQHCHPGGRLPRGHAGALSGWWLGGWAGWPRCTGACQGIKRAGHDRRGGQVTSPVPSPCSLCQLAPPPRGTSHPRLCVRWS